MHSASSAGAFYSAYQARLKELRHIAGDSATAHAHVVDALIDARRVLQQAPPLPPRDVLQYESELRSIQRLIAERARSGHVFRFKRPEHRPQPLPAEPHPKCTHIEQQPSVQAPTNICGRRDSVIALDTLPTLYVSDVHNCVLIAPRVLGSVLAEECTGTTLISECGQLRVSRSSQMTLLVDVPAKVTLEECTQVAVGNLRTRLPCVQDFSDVRDTHRNWRKLSEKEIQSIRTKFALALDAPAPAASYSDAAPA